MIAPDLRSGVEQLGDMIAAASTIVPFTGAGISTECGIPDFRSPGGLWTRNRPIPFDEFVASPEARDEAWRRRFAMEPTFAAAQARARSPRARLALPGRQDSGHHHPEHRQSASGCRGLPADHVVELHGNTTYARCIGCGRAYDLAWVKQSFEADRRRARLHRLRRAGQDRDHLVRAGDAGRRDARAPPNWRSIATCSLRSDRRWWSGRPPGFPMMAKNCGARLVIINNEPTDQDDIADLVIRHDIGETLGPFVGN